MSLIDLSGKMDEIQNAQEPTIAKNGSEHKLRIISCRGGEATEKVSGNECTYISPVYEVPNEPLVKEFSSFLWIPDEGKLSPKAYARAMSDFNIFSKCFGLDLSKPFDYEDDLPGLTGWAILGTKKSDEYGEQNTIRKFVVGQ